MKAMIWNEIYGLIISGSFGWWRNNSQAMTSISFALHNKYILFKTLFYAPQLLICDYPYDTALSQRPNIRTQVFI